MTWVKGQGIGMIATVPRRITNGNAISHPQGDKKPFGISSQALRDEMTFTNQDYSQV